ncbi:L-serine ammonia-lyase [Thiomonas sp. FB-6]|uniref:L-serine ammonia-lyase n=1 Tax=Thiomonas sp. FB-6 TaxID=1158291 RepID=UPI000367E89E|nr:L-serine ammonia-lyase [Thiomonas sp. FB-6]
MVVSVFELFRIGIGPSSSHTVGPMRAARAFACALADQGLLERTARVSCRLYGSLSATGRGHGSDRAVLLGFMGETPDGIDPDRIPQLLQALQDSGSLPLLGRHAVPFDARRDLVLERGRGLSLHPNGMRFEAHDAAGALLLQQDMYSIGGGFVVDARTLAAGQHAEPGPALPLPFHSAEELLGHCARLRCSIGDVMRLNERCWRGDEAIDSGLLGIWHAMRDCAARGCRADEGELPGGFRVRLRAPALWRSLQQHGSAGQQDPLRALDWVNLWALAVNEQNASGGRVVTAPTNGAAGIVPAVLHYYVELCPGADEAGVVEFLLTAGAIGVLYKENASISGAEVGCQGEVGVACSMAAAGLCAVLGGSPAQVENAAEIGMEHHLGLTCDPVGGLVQVPCIERNAMGAVQAINSARMALHGSGHHLVSLDQVIKTMRETGADMRSKYKETSRGGLAVNIIEC